MTRMEALFLALAGVTIVGATGLAGAQTRPAPAAAAAPSGEALFLGKCGYCHLEGGTGTMMLERRLGKGKALLGKRTDLPADYVKAVARNGLNSMPTITRVEVTDAELDRIAAFIASKKKAGGK
ncbi:MAG: cytochrome c [Sphingomonadales bacterium]|nr:cytochrome c [Sphingomonadales bacterium]